MFRNFLNNSSLMSMVVRAPDNENGAPEKTEVEKAREAIAKNTVVAGKEEAPEKEVDIEEDGDEENEKEDDAGDGDEEDKDDDEKEEDEGVKETAEEKAAREAKETEAEKEKRKSDRIQKRIDKAVAAQRIAEARVAALEAQLKADPDKTLTEEEINKRAEAIAADKLAADNLAKVQKDFEKACDKLNDAAIKLDKEFTPKVVAMAEELGPIPSRVIGILDDLDNGAEVLKFLVDDIDEAEKIYDLKERPEKLAIALVRISDKLAAAKAPRPRPISRVPNPVTPVNGSRVQSNTITGKETTEEYIRKRTAQREEQRKQRGY